MAILSMISCAPTTHFKPAVNDPLVLTNIKQDQVSLLTYNIQAIFGKDESKLDALVDYINTEEYDFVVFQELFDEKARDFILSKIDTNAYKSVVSRVDYDSFPELLFQDAGLFIMAKYPQIDLSGINFDDEISTSDGAMHMILTKELSITTDFLANKSVVGALYQINDSTNLFLFTTHVQAIGSKRQKRRQIKQIKNFIDYAIYAVLKSGTIENSDNMVVILSGDFNTDAYNEENLAQLLNDLGSPRELHKEIHATKKEYTMIFKMINMYKRFDYIFAYDSIGGFPLRKVKVQSINATDVQNKNSESLSDHMGLKASLVFENTKDEEIKLSRKERQAK